MMELQIKAELNEKFIDVGSIKTLSGVGAVFSYDECWRSYPGAQPLSLSLPLRSKPYTEKELKPYFEGLLPEADARAAAAHELGVSSRSYLKLIQALGCECIGALLLTASEDGYPLEQFKPSYQAFTQDDFEGLAIKGYGRSGEIIADTRLSLAGAQAKIGLYRDPLDQSWWLPLETAPSNYIAKPFNKRFPDLVDNELFCLELARSSGLPTVNALKIDTEYPILLTERYDRIASKSGRIIDGHPAYIRLHQEDFSQALGILARNKYEEGSQYHYVARMNDLLRRYSSDAITDTQRLFEMQVFNYLIGNCDAHCKNFSLVRNEDWQEIRLAPFYDLASTSVYPELSRTMGMHIGSVSKLDKITYHDFLDLARELKISARLANRYVSEICERVVESLNKIEIQNAISEQIALEAKTRLDTLTLTS